MDRIYHRYEYWEDYKNNMYSTLDSNNIEKIKLAYKLLSNSDLFLKKAIEMLQVYKISKLENLTNMFCNRKAWIGQATCNFTFNCTEIQVREAWNRLNDIEKYKANLQADKLIKSFELEYEAKNSKVYQILGK
jgi:hypothetical protein